MTAPTSPWNIPLFGTGDTIGPLASVFNSQSNALNTALNNLQTQAFAQYSTLAALNLVTGSQVGQHATVYADPTPANNCDYTWSGSAWVAAPVSTTTTGAFTPAGIYSNGASPNAPTLTRQYGLAVLTGVVTSASASFVSGTTYTIGSITAALAPTVNQVFACMSNTTAVAQIVITTSGSVTLTLNTSFTGALNLNLNCIWRR